MKEKLPKISVVIPVRPEGEIVRALFALEKVDYPEELIEVFVVYGFNPSRQRNQAARRCRGEIIYFLDNDSEIGRLAFKRTVAAFKGRFRTVNLRQLRGFSFLPAWLSKLIIEKLFSGTIYKGEVGAVGGPNVWWGKETFWASIAGIVLESFFAHSLMAARYRPIGQAHRSSEKELILCNLAIRRDVFTRLGGLNETLYPNEENEILNRIEKAGYQLIYHPGVLVFRPRRQTFRALIGAFGHYGRGRMDQVKVEGVWQNLPLLAPLILLGYLAGLVFYHPWFVFIPLFFYLGLGFGSALGFAARRKKPYLAIFLPLVFLATHLAYALGLLLGLVVDPNKRSQRRSGKVKVTREKGFNQGWRETQKLAKKA